MPPGYRSIIKALKAGFLSRLVDYVGGTYPHIAIDPVKLLLAVILPPSTIYHPVLTEMKPALIQVATLHWKKFQRVAKDRMKVMEWFDSDEYEACDNIEPARPSIGAREVTEEHTLPIGDIASPGDPEPYNIRDDSFLPRLLHHDYERSKRQIFRAQAFSLLLQPHKHLCTEFDYTGPFVVVSHSPTNDDAGRESNTVDPESIQWEESVSRAVKSRGRMHTHAMWSKKGWGGNARG
ncbi:hypothetical protein DFH07DRAFT_784491 [Mycena maculata]|uniref:Uncharacterized protein n=1 Tax=Mycena maculata TaxID=230809 RepID=A0AAD7HHN5_9AGAR|nr:hypothetical protein DFH07DRAFT_784491 [Mycena maculata]